MAHTAHRTEDELIEHFDADDVVEAKAIQLAELIKSSSHCVVFTGAGISTSSGIGDFRGPTGLWTMAAQGKRAPASAPMTSAIATYAHMALVELQNRGLLKYVISQNVDGLHRRSGIPHSAISELHGNDNKEMCNRCGREYMRDFSVRCAQGVKQHDTGRVCDDRTCNGMLCDTIVNFGEQLPAREIKRAIAHSCEADLHIILGSSCRVTPAADLPNMTLQKEGKVVVCNLQTTPLDHNAALVIRALTDHLLRLVMQHLNIPVPAFTLQRYFCLSTKPQHRDATRCVVELSCLDAENEAVQLFNKVEVIAVQDDTTMPTTTTTAAAPVAVLLHTAPYVYEAAVGTRLVFRVHFEGNYNEPVLELPIVVQQQQQEKEVSEVVWKVKFVPNESTAWEVTQCARPQSHVDADNIITRLRALEPKPVPNAAADIADDATGTAGRRTTASEGTGAALFDLDAPAPHLKGVAVQPRRCPTSKHQTVSDLGLCSLPALT
eukprot:TRINITY_DN2911_c2_g1_i2.p1 TRINITY_DN2911_c2_g1~~TRINITY_DN2911_c2_g1_i2.p1  ORF type:complete len:492 (-),score=107.03 TRINITY_DN2911_c2_g1_i2:406-1881(-)